MDARTVPLNPCSVESIPEGVTLADGRRVWPVAISCYELLEKTTERVGRLEWHMIEIPDIVHRACSMPLQFQTDPYVVLDTRKSSGILDGKWSSIFMPTTGCDNTSGDQSWCFASAHSTGEIRIHSFHVGIEQLDDSSDSDQQFSCNFMGQSDPPPPLSRDDTTSSPPLCLSLAWDSAAAYKRKEVCASELPRIVSTYSDGRVAIHDVAFDSASSTARLIRRDCWEAHTLFHNNPAEVWSACFVGRHNVWSGGDEGSVKVWDVRAPLRPTQVLSDIFEAGVTCLSPHPTMESIVAVGSCTLSSRLVPEILALWCTLELMLSFPCFVIQTMRLFACLMPDIWMKGGLSCAPNPSVVAFGESNGTHIVLIACWLVPCTVVVAS